MRGTEWVALTAIVLLGSWLRILDLGAASLWFDEAYSVKFAGMPWSTLWLSGYDNTPPLYYSFLKLFLSIDDSEFIIRLPSALAGILTIPLVYWAGRLLGGPWAGLGAALFLALSTAQIEYSQEARAYSLLGTGIALALVGLLILIAAHQDKNTVTGQEVKWRPAVAGCLLYGLGSLLALYAHNIAVFFVFCVQLVIVWHWWRVLRCERRFLLLWLGVNTAVFFLWLPWLQLILFELWGNGTFDWLEQATPAKVIEAMRHVHGFPFVWFGQPWIDLLVALMLLVGIWHLRTRHEVLLLVSVVLLGPALIWLIGYFEPMYMIRTVQWSGLGSALLVGVVVARYKGTRGLLVLAAIGILSGRSAWSYYSMNAAENENWREAYAWVKTHIDPMHAPQAVLFCARHTAVPMLYYARNDGVLPPWYGWVELKDGYTIRPIAGHSNSDSWNSPAWTRLDVVEAKCKATGFQNQQLQGALAEEGWQQLDREKFKGIKLYSYGCDSGCRIPAQGDTGH